MEKDLPVANTALLEFEDNWGKSTEKKAPEKPIRAAPPKKDDFELEEEEPEKTPADPAKNATSEEPIKKEETKLSSELSGELTTDGIDFLQSMIFKIINNRKILRRIGKENIARFADLLTDLEENKKKPEGLSDSDTALFLRFKRLFMIGEEIPFDDKEHEKLSELWTKYYKETGKSIPPWLGLSIALAESIGGRLSDALTE